MMYVLSESFLHLLLWLIFRQLRPDFINVRLKNLNTDDKKSSHKIRHIKIPIEHIFLYRQIPLTLLNGYLSFSM